MDLNNITVDSLKEKFAAFDRKTLTKFGIGIGAIILFLIIYFMILKPMVDERKAKYADKTLKIQEIKQFENDIVSIKSQIKKIEPIVKKNSTLFHSKAEVEGLYDSLSRFASRHSLVISKITKKKAVPVLKPGVAKQAENLLKQNQISYYKIPVDFKGVEPELFLNVRNALDAVYVQDATDNSRFNAEPFRVNSHSANAAEVYLGLPSSFNL